MPAHYALSEAVLTFSAAWAVRQLWAHRAPYAAMGAALLATAALIGTIRFGLGLQDSLSALHRAVSQLGGLSALTLITAQLVSARIWPRQPRADRAVACLGLAAALALALLWRPALMPLLLLLALIIPALIGLRAYPRLRDRWLAMAGASLFLINALFIRRSALLDPDLSWHLSHLVMAAWIAGLAVSLRRPAA